MDYIPLVREVGAVFSVPNGSGQGAVITHTFLNTVARWVYTILALIVVFYGSYYIFTKMERQIAGILYFIGAVIAVYFYWVKWFVIPGAKPEWPPYQTMCPDYLTPVAPGYEKDARGRMVPGQGGMKCVDFIGVSTNGTLKMASKGSLHTQINNPEYVFTIAPKMSREQLRAQVNARGLSWQSMFGDDTRN